MESSGKDTDPNISTARAVWLANMTGFANQLSVGMIHFSIPLYALEQGASPAVVGVIVAASSIAGFVVALPAGKQIDRLGAKKAVSYATLCKVLSMLIFLFISAPAALILPTFLTGIFGTVSSSVFIVMYLDWPIVRSAPKASATSRYSRVGGIGWSGSCRRTRGPGELPGFFRLHGDILRFDSRAALCFFQPPSQAARKKARAAARFPWPVIPSRRANGAFGRRLFRSAAQLFHRAFLPVLLYRIYSATEIASFFAVTTFATVLGRSAVRSTAGLWSLEKSLTITILANAVPLMSMPVALGHLPLALLTFLFGISSGFLAVITVVQIADTVAAQERGLAFGMRTTLMRLCSFTGQLAFGSLAEITSIGLSFFGMGLLGIIGAITLLDTIIALIG